MKPMLKPCPFCGGKAIVEEIPPHKHIIADMPDCDGETYIECTVCGCCIGADTTEKAIEKWNRRKNETDTI